MSAEITRISKDNAVAATVLVAASGAGIIIAREVFKRRGTVKQQQSERERLREIDKDNFRSGASDLSLTPPEYRG